MGALRKTPERNEAVKTAQKPELLPQETLAALEVEAQNPAHLLWARLREAFSQNSTAANAQAPAPQQMQDVTKIFV